MSAHSFDSQQGTLGAFQVISTLPKDADSTNNTTAEIDMTPNGKYLYASNRGHDSLALFAVGEDGSLTAKGFFATEATPRFFALDPSGQFVYAAGQGSGQLAAYRIDQATGVLARLATYEVGQSPLWVQFVKQL